MKHDIWCGGVYRSPGRNWRETIRAVMISATLLGAAVSISAQPQRVLGLDVSAWQGNISQTTWNNIRNVENRQFVILRSSRGGTTGYYNQSDPNNNNGLNTLSQRYDDPYFVQNINRATTAGLFAGSYHFSRPEIIESTPHSNGIRNTGTDEADHFIQMAGPWMRPGYLLPVHDLESGDGVRTDDEMAQFCIDFSARIYQVMGIRPAIYLNGNYAAFVIGGASASLRNQIAQPAGGPPTAVSPACPTLWSARWPNQADPNSIDVQNGEPKDSYTPIYGPWDDYGITHPWTFWQYASTLRLQSFNNGGSNLDADVARGGIEFLKDQLVPAVWMNDSDGQWTTLGNWNCGQTPVAPVTGPGQVRPVGTQTLPTPRLPGGAGSGVTSGQHDTVILERPSATITVTLASGTHNIRKLYMREALTINGGALTVNYMPSIDSTPYGAQFSGPVTLNGSGSLTLHTLQVDASQTFTLGGGTLTFNTITLMPHSPSPARILAGGNVTINALSNATASIEKGSGAGSAGFVDLGAGTRTVTVNNSAADVDLSVDVTMSNGSLAKAGAGTMRLTSANNYSGGTIVTAGRLLVNNTSGSGTGTGAVAVSGGTLGGTGTIGGAVTVSSAGTLAPGTSIGTLTLNSPPTFAGTNLFEIDRNGGAPRADRLVLTSGTLNYSGTLVVSNTGAALTGGEAFALFSAPAYSGAFATTVLPVLNAGLNWYTEDLTVNGTIRVNRSPIAGVVNFTNEAPTALQIPITRLLSMASDLDGDTISFTGFDSTSANGVPLLTKATFIVYSNYVSLADQFSYSLSDAHGGNATGIVQIVASPAGRFASAASSNGHSMTLHFVGSPGWTYHLERSTALPVWTTIWTNTAPASGLFDYTDEFGNLPEPPSSAFYRLRWAP